MFGQGSCGSTATDLTRQDGRHRARCDTNTLRDRGSLYQVFVAVCTYFVLGKNCSAFVMRRLATLTGSPGLSGKSCCGNVMLAGGPPSSNTGPSPDELLDISVVGNLKFSVWLSIW